MLTDHTVLNLNIALLTLMILISVLLIIILSLLLRCTLKRFRKKSTSHHRSTDTANEDGRESRVGSPSLNIVRTHLDLDMPYAPLSTVAPPSYEDTLVADQIVQQDSAPEYTLEGDTATSLQEVADDLSSSLSADNLLLPSIDIDATSDRATSA